MLVVILTLPLNTMSIWATDTVEITQSETQAETGKALNETENVEAMEAQPLEEAVSNDIEKPEEIQNVKTKTTTYVNPIYEDVTSEKDLAQLPEKKGKNVT